jgi:hypothetical protein
VRIDRYAVGVLAAAATIVAGLAVASPTRVENSVVRLGSAPHHSCLQAAAGGQGEAALQRLGNGVVAQQRQLWLVSDGDTEANSEKIKP